MSADFRPKAVQAAHERDQRLNQSAEITPPGQWVRRWNAALGSAGYPTGRLQCGPTKNVVVAGEREVSGPARADGLWMHARWVFSASGKGDAEVVSYSFTFRAPPGAVGQGFRSDYMPTQDAPSHPLAHRTHIQNQNIRLPAGFMTPDELMWLFMTIPRVVVTLVNRRSTAIQLQRSSPATSASMIFRGIAAAAQSPVCSHT